MEALAYIHVVAHYEELNSSSEVINFEGIKLNALQVVKSAAIAVGCITSGVTTGAEAQVETVHKALIYGDRGSVLGGLQSKFDVHSVEGILGSPTLTLLKSYLDIHGETVEEVVTQKIPQTVRPITNAQVANQAPLQKRKLKLINDLPRPTIIYMRKQGDVRYRRYAYLEGCTKRTLEGNYTRSWNVSVDLRSWHPINNVLSGEYGVMVSRIEGQKRDAKKCIVGDLRSGLEEDLIYSRSAGVQEVYFLSKGRQLFASASVLPDLVIHLRNGLDETVKLFEQMSKYRQDTSEPYQKLVKIFKENPLENFPDIAARNRAIYIEFQRYVDTLETEFAKRYFEGIVDTSYIESIDNRLSTHADNRLKEGTTVEKYRQELESIFQNCKYEKNASQIIQAL
ncbi:hypothetical protein WDZ92_38480, partial [Nostoc sp. NIES-2111]